MIISILIPCFNEEESIYPLYERLKYTTNSLGQYNWEYIFVNDGSTDKTLSIIKKLADSDESIKNIDLSRNFGKEAAMLAGIDFARGDAVIIMDADLQHPPYLIQEMIHEWEKGYDDIYAKRIRRGKEFFLRKNLTKIYYNLLKKLAKIDILPNAGDFRLLDRKCVEALKQLRESERYTKGLYCWIGFNKKEIPFIPDIRKAGKSSWTYSKLFSLAINGITSFSIAPLRLSIFLGFLISLFAFVYLIIILIRTLIYGDEVRGFPTLIIIILFLGGIQLVSLGIIGEYIGKIFIETKKRPNYIIRDKNF